MKEFTLEELNLHIESAISKVKNLLNNYKEKDRKRAILLGYWINDYVGYLKKEDDFKAPKHKYNRGDIVQVNFGYRLGSELGGRHFAVVIDAHNKMNSTVVTVIPLTSLKEKTKNSLYTIILEKGLFELQSEKFDRLLNKAIQTERKLDEIFKDVDDGKSEKLDEEQFNLVKEEMKKFESQIEELKGISNQIESLKTGTVAQISQITTISKMRISNPVIAKDSLNGIKLSSVDMDRISENLKKIYFK